MNTPSAPYASRRPPRAHQAEALRRIEGQRAFAILMGMRTGKTKVIVDDFGRMISTGEARDLIVVAPAGAYLPWQDAIRDDILESMQKDLRTFIWQSGRMKTREKKIELAEFKKHPGPRVLLMNVEAISFIEAARSLVVEFLEQSPGKNVFAVDESVIIKEPTSKCGKFVADVGPKAAYRRILTGLVTPRSPLDLWNQFRFLDPSILGYQNFVAFRARYADVKQICMVRDPIIRGKLRKLVGTGVRLTKPELAGRVIAIDPQVDPRGWSETQMRDYLAAAADGMKRDAAIEAIGRLGGYIQTVPTIRAYKNEEELREKIAPYSYRVRLEDCYDMPSSDYSFRDVEMHPEQRRLYDEVRQNACAQLESLDHVTATHVIVQMLRLHQILCGHVRDEEGKLHEVPEYRTRELLNLLRDYDGKAVVWCSYDPDVRRVDAALRKEYGDGMVSRFWGGNVKTREEEEERFKKDPECRFQVATPDAGGRGRDWSAADLVAYYSSRNNLDHRQQSEDRVKAMGKDHPIAYVDLRAPGTVEDGIIRCLRNKLDMATLINGEEWRQWLI